MRHWVVMKGTGRKSEIINDMTRKLQLDVNFSASTLLLAVIKRIKRKVATILDSRAPKRKVGERCQWACLRYSSIHGWTLYTWVHSFRSIAEMKWKLMAISHMRYIYSVDLNWIERERERESKCFGNFFLFVAGGIKKVSGKNWKASKIRCIVIIWTRRPHFICARWLDSPQFWLPT